MIVAIHSYSAADLVLDSYTSRFLFNLVSGATLNFIFISGFLFYLVFYEKFEFFKFVKGRIDRYLKPYLFLSILPIAISLLTMPMYWDNSIIIDFNKDTIGTWHFISTLKYLVSGAHITAYWYIPFIMLMVLLSPLFVAFVKLNITKQLIIFGIFLTVSMLIHRPFERVELFQAVHSVFYFTSIYLMGIICAIHRTKIYEVLHKKELYLLGIVLLIVVWQTNQGHLGLYKTEFLVYNGIDLVVIKMLFFCLFFMIWLHRFEHVKSYVISTIAAASFTIYFLHVYFLKGINIVKDYFNLSFENYAFIAYILLVMTIIFLSTITARLLYRLIPNYTRILIGYNKRAAKNPKSKWTRKLIFSRK